ncbi:MAG: AAA family ATPase [Candidatus Marinimicrobia bacterium]|nr:AAA family ATPase [Candidatus Neomarinimicrobiota bacterium]
MIFELIGQEQIAERFRALNGKKRIGSAYLFTGPEGSGKTAMAMNVAAMFLCGDPRDGAACGQCPACAKLRHLNHPNFHFIHALPRSKNPSENDPFAGLRDDDIGLITREEQKLSLDPYYQMNIPKANNILISSIRELKRKLAMGQAEKGRQIILIQRVERATREAYSALLKVLEEPPRGTTFILTAESVDPLPPTIASRCQTVRFNPIPDTKIADHMVEKGRNKTDALRIARLSGGNVKQAKDLTETDFSDIDTMILDFWRILMGSKINDRRVTNADLYTLTEHFSKIAKDDPSEFRNYLRFIIFWLRDTQLTSSQPEAEAQLINPHLSREIRRFAEFYPDFPHCEMIRFIERTLDDINRNAYIPLSLANLFMELRMHLLSSKRSTAHETQ